MMNAIWKCPALCGCELSITANWATPPVLEDGRRVSYQHPIPRTITNIAIEAVCAEHDALRTAPFPADPYFGSPGYLPIPETPTEAERLYIHLFRYVGQRVRPRTCQCRMCEVHDRAGTAMRRVAHRLHTRKCSEHLDDDDQHTNARENASRLDRLLNRAATTFGLNVDDLAWEFRRVAGQRVLHITLTGATAQQKTQAQTWADANIGVGRVVVE